MIFFIFVYFFLGIFYLKMHTFYYTIYFIHQYINHNIFKFISSLNLNTFYFLFNKNLNFSQLVAISIFTLLYYLYFVNYLLLIYKLFSCSYLIHPWFKNQCFVYQRWFFVVVTALFFNKHFQLPFREVFLNPVSWPRPLPVPALVPLSIRFLGFLLAYTSFCFPAIGYFTIQDRIHRGWSEEEREGKSPAVFFFDSI